MIVNGDWLLLPERAAIHLPTATAVLADLHLGYSEARRRTGEALPLVSLEETLAPLGNVLKKNGVCRLLVAGDLFEAGFHSSLAQAFANWATTVHVDFLGLIPGNHDRNLERASFPIHPQGVVLGPWRVLHGDQLPANPCERIVHGHWHPSFRWQGRKRPCYLFNEMRLILPAYSLDAAGVTRRQIPDGCAFRWIVIRENRLLEIKPKPVAAFARMRGE